MFDNLIFVYKQYSNGKVNKKHVLGQISRSFHYRDQNVFMKLYKSHVLSHLEFSVQAWSPWTEADKLVLENVQKRAVRMVTGLSGSYGENLKDLNLQSLDALDMTWSNPYFSLIICKHKRFKWVWEPFPHLNGENGSECGIGMDCPVCIYGLPDTNRRNKIFRH